MTSEHSQVGTAALALGALGVVYGDIGTSPLYSLKEAFTEEAHVMTVDRINVYGVCSLAFWSLIVIISVKYLLFVMRADNRGEGGILALTALVMPRKGPAVAKAGILVTLGVFGTSLLYGDGIITPAISVLSAVEGLEEVSTSFADWVVPIAVAIIIGLFLVQSRGTGAVGKVFGPIMMLWFATIAVLGLTHIVDAPGIIASVNPYLPPSHGITTIGNWVMLTSADDTLKPSVKPKAVDVATFDHGAMSGDTIDLIWRSSVSNTKRACSVRLFSSTCFCISSRRAYILAPYSRLDS